MLLFRDEFSFVTPVGGVEMCGIHDRRAVANLVW